MKKILSSLFVHSCIAFVCFALAACSTPLHTSRPSNQVQGIVTDLQYDEISSAEPEETAQEELEALNKPGAWEYGVNKTYSLEKLGIDPSKYDFPITVNKQVLYYLELFQGKQRNYFSQWLARSSIYRPHVEVELKKAGLPADLVFLAMIESGFNPSAYSPAKACGLWQFIEGTGHTYGLKIDSWVDERRDPDKATHAAIKYLSRLHAQFGDWYLAVAAYNAGERKIDDAMKTFNAKDFWEVATSEGIFMETKRYVPKLIAAIIIARNPEKYGFTNIGYKKRQESEVINIPGGTHLGAVATLANTSIKELRTLNNELRKDQAPPKNEYALRLPPGTKSLVASNLDKLRTVTTTVYLTHTVKKDDTLDGVCSLYNISKTTLLKANNLKTAQLSKGSRLQIPSIATKYVLPKDGHQSEERIAKGGNESKQHHILQYTIKSGETLDSIAKQYQLSVHDIKSWNKIFRSIVVKPGQKISLHLDRPMTEKIDVAANVASTASINFNIGKETAPIPTLEATRKQIVAKNQYGTAVPMPKQSVAASQQEPLPTWYVVRNGDTLPAIARKFQASAQNIRTWNKLSGNTLQTGDKLIVKKG